MSLLTHRLSNRRPFSLVNFQGRDCYIFHKMTVPLRINHSSQAELSTVFFSVDSYTPFPLVTPAALYQNLLEVRSLI